MVVDVLTEIVIERPLAEVFAYAIHPDHATAWYEMIQRVEWDDATPFGQGHRVDFVANFLGKRLAYTYEILELTENRKMVMKAIEGPFPMETTYTFEAVGAGRTRMGLRQVGEPGGFFRLVARLVGPAIRRANQKDLERLKRVLEREA